MITEKKIEIAYQVFAGREGRLTWRRKMVPASKLEAALAKLLAGDVHEIQTREVSA